MTSLLFACQSCNSDVELTQINSDDLAYVCQNPRCGRAVHVDCPEGLHLRDELELNAAEWGGELVEL